jgi:hypothetical protein
MVQNQDAKTKQRNGKGAGQSCRRQSPALQINGCRRKTPDIRWDPHTALEEHSPPQPLLNPWRSLVNRPGEKKLAEENRSSKGR